jgi:hypothetical protein
MAAQRIAAKVEIGSPASRIARDIDLNLIKQYALKIINLALPEHFLLRFCLQAGFFDSTIMLLHKRFTTIL